MPAFLSSSAQLLFGVLIGVLVACGGGGGGPTDPPDDPAGTIGPAGGTVRSANSNAGVTVPSGSLTSKIVITITPVGTPTDLRAVGAIGQAYRFAPEGQQFSKLVTIEIFISDAALVGINLSTLSLFASDGVTAGLAPAGVSELSGVTTTPTTGGLTVRGLISHFSVMSVTGDPAATGPTASAGADQTVTLGATVILSGAGSNPGGGAVTLSWVFVSRPAGSAAALTGATSLTPSFVPDVAGTYELRLTVTNATGLTATDTVLITVNPSTSVVPIANAGVDQLVNLGATVTLSGNATGTPTPTLSWQFVSVPAGGGPPVLNNPTTTTPVFIPSRGGVYIVELTATNSQGSDKDSVRVTVNAPPVVGIIAPASAIVGQAITLGSSASDPDGDALTVTFSLITRPGGSTAVLSGDTFTPDVVGEYVVQVSASDGHFTRTATASIIVVPNVAGIYDITFTLQNQSGCGAIETPVAIGPKATPVTQNGNFVTLDLVTLTSTAAVKIFSNPTGVLDPNGDFHFSGPLQFQNPSTGQPIGANTNINGDFSPGGQLNLNFNFSVFGVCVGSGFMRGPKL